MANTQPQTVGYPKIFVAIDYEDSTSEVFNKALELAKIFGSQLMIFHALQRPLGHQSESLVYATFSGYSGIYSAESLELEEQLLEERETEFHHWLSSFAQRATAEGITAILNYQVGEAGQQICRVAKDWNSNLIIIGRSGRQGLSELLLGSVSNYVIHHAPCSVLVIQAQVS